MNIDLEKTKIINPFTKNNNKFKIIIAWDIRYYWIGLGAGSMKICQLVITLTTFPLLSGITAQKWG